MLGSLQHLRVWTRCCARRAAMSGWRIGEFITLIAGDGEERESLSELHKQLGLRNTFFLGNQKQDELRRLYNAADVL